MEKVIKEYYCDYCGKKCEHTEFVMPEVEKIQAIDWLNDSSVNYEETIKSKKKDICPKCQEKIVKLLGLLDAVSICNNGLIEIKFK